MEPELIPVLTEAEIAERVRSMARRISEAYANRPLIMIGVLKGAFIFLSDLIRCLTIPVTVDFVRAASYGSGTESCGSVAITKDIESDIRDRHVIVVEDIVDSGLTLARLVEHLKCFKPASVKICAMIDKRERREADLSVDFAGHVVDEGFLVGYGLDYAENYRQLPGIFDLKL